MNALDVILDGRSAAWLARRLNVDPSAVRKWRRRGVPRKWRRQLLDFARSRGIAIAGEDMIGETTNEN